MRPMGRQARGVRAMDLRGDDYLVGMEVVEKDGLILSIAEHGYGKRTPLENYRLTTRGGKGVINMKTTTKTGKVVAILSVKEDSDLMIVSQNGKIIRHRIVEIRQAGRSTQGVRLVQLEEGDQGRRRMRDSGDRERRLRQARRPAGPAAPVGYNFGYDHGGRSVQSGAIAREGGKAVSPSCATWAA